MNTKDEWRLRLGNRCHSMRPKCFLSYVRSFGFRIPERDSVRGVDEIHVVASEVLDEDDGMKSPCVVNLHNMVTVAKTGIGRRLTKLSDEKMSHVGDALSFCLGCEGT